MAILAATLIDQAKGLADKRNDASIVDADWLVYVNWGLKALYRLITAADPGAYFAMSDFTLAGGAGAGSRRLLSTLTWLDADGSALLGTPMFAALHGLDKDPDTNLRRTIPRRNFRQRNLGRIGWWAPTVFDDNRAYDLRGRVLVMTPYEIAAGTYRAYARIFPYLFTAAGDGNPLDWQLEPYDEFVVIMAARKGLGIEESDTGLQSERLQELRAEITAEHSRDDGEAATIADVEDDVTWSDGGY